MLEGRERLLPIFAAMNVRAVSEMNAGVELHPPDDSPTRNFGDCDRNRIGFRYSTASTKSALCPRRRISIAVFGTASGSLTPQSQAELSQMRSRPQISSISTARGGDD